MPPAVAQRVWGATCCVHGFDLLENSAFWVVHWPGNGTAQPYESFIPPKWRRKPTCARFLITDSG
jgi:hypothetical protein